MQAKWVTCLDMVSNMKSDKAREERLRRQREHNRLRETNKATLTVQGRNFGISMHAAICTTMCVHFLWFLLLRSYCHFYSTHMHNDYMYVRN